MDRSILIALLLFCFCCYDVTARRRVYHGKSGNRIVGGYNITIQQVPYQVYLLLHSGNDYYQCGGSIISKNYVLTAAHCLQGMDRAIVRVGSTEANSGGTQYNTTSFRQHPLYNPDTFDYDIGVVNITEGMMLDGVNTRAVRLPRIGTTIRNGTNILVTGWGDTSENGQVSESLIAVQIPTVSQDECRKTYSTLTSRQFCAGEPEGGKDSCQGDSGGPAVSTETKRQLGVVSFGDGCARPGTPGVYTNVARVRMWIRLVTGV